MKMTMHIEEELLARVMKDHGFASKTEAVAMALREMDRRTRFKKFVRTGFNFTAEELKASVDPAYDVLALRAAGVPAANGKRRPRR